MPPSLRRLRFSWTHLIRAKQSLRRFVRNGRFVYIRVLMKRRAGAVCMWRRFAVCPTRQISPFAMWRILPFAVVSRRLLWLPAVEHQGVVGHPRTVLRFDARLHQAVSL